MAEIIDGSLGGLRSVEYLEIVLGFRNFNYFFLLLDGWLGWCGYFLGSA